MPGDEVEIKIILLGDSAVGKTSLLTRIIQNTFAEDPSSTIGATYSYKKVKCGDKEVQMQIWDTAGQERYRCLAPIYYRGTNVVFLVYAINDRNSFGVIDFWTKSLNENSASPSLIFLIANKMDIKDENKEIDLISSEEGMEKAESIGAQYIQVSAKTGNNVEVLMKMVAQMYIDKLKDGTALVKRSSGNTPKENGDKANNCCS